MTRLLAAFAAVAFATSALATGTLEVPGNGGEASGIGYFSGWKCPPNDNISLVIDGGSPIPIATGIRRGDTASVCGNGGFNGYISQFNFNLLGDGNHSVSVRQNGAAFAAGTFHVTTFGSNFLSGASGTYTLSNFPASGRSATVEWSEGAQNFIITGASIVPATPTPKPGHTPTPTPPPVSGAQVRYGNNTSCGGANFTSTLASNGFSWDSFSGVFSAYQFVNRATLGPPLTFNSTCGTFSFAMVFNLPAGHRIAFVQSFESGNVALTEFDEGLVSTADAAAEGAPGEVGVPIAVIPGVAVINGGAALKDE